jgi:REP element-mobilizing transposase RayT
VEDHVHLFTSLHPTLSLADFVKSIKISTHGWMETHGGFPAFTSWQEAYGAFTHSLEEKPRLMEYVRNQQEHHKKESFLDEYRRLVAEAGLKFDERYLP